MQHDSGDKHIYSHRTRCPLAFPVSIFNIDIKMILHSTLVSALAVVSLLPWLSFSAPTVSRAASPKYVFAHFMVSYPFQKPLTLTLISLIGRDCREL